MSYYCPLIYKYEYLLYLNNYKGILRQNMIVTASVPNRLVLKKMLSLSLSLSGSLVQLRKAEKHPDKSEKLLTETY